MDNFRIDAKKRKRARFETHSVGRMGIAVTEKSEDTDQKKDVQMVLLLNETNDSMWFKEVKWVVRHKPTNNWRSIFIGAKETEAVIQSVVRPLKPK